LTFFRSDTREIGARIRTSQMPFRPIKKHLRIVLVEKMLGFYPGLGTAL